MVCFIYMSPKPTFNANFLIWTHSHQSSCIMGNFCNQLFAGFPGWRLWHTELHQPVMQLLSNDHKTSLSFHFSVRDICHRYCSRCCSFPHFPRSGSFPVSGTQIDLLGETFTQRLTPSSTFWVFMVFCCSVG